MTTSIKSISSSRKPVIVELKGGLGNQMFQYAAARSLADRLGVELFLDVSHYINDPLRKYELGAFKIRANLLPPKKSFRYLLKYFSLRNVTDFEETSSLFDERFILLREGIRLKGYFQSEKYFATNMARIQSDFKLKHQLSELSSKLKEQIQSSNCPVSLHIRRGDYATNAHTNAFHGLMPIQYYKDAVDLIKSRNQNINLFIFSDDPEWVKSHILLDSDQSVMQANPSDRGYEDMYLMSICRHHILANSSFSWWGAWLANSKDQHVIAPKRWFLSEAANDRDLVPDRWSRI